MTNTTIASTSAIASTTTSTNANIQEENTMSNSIVIAQLQTLDLLANKMMNILEASIARAKSNPELLIDEDTEEYTKLFKETVQIFTSLPEEYRIKAHLKTDKWMGANLDTKDNEMLSSYIKVGRTLFSDLLAEAMNKQYQLLGY